MKCAPNLASIQSQMNSSINMTGAINLVNQIELKCNIEVDQFITNLRFNCLLVYQTPCFQPLPGATPGSTMVISVP